MDRVISEEVRTVLLNLDWIYRNRVRDSEDGLDMVSETLIYGDGGVDLYTLTEPGFTPATRGRRR